MELVQEPLAVDMDVKKAIKTSKHWTLKSFRATQVKHLNLLLQGLSFFFKINGQPIFMKGSNWIPAHVLPEQVKIYVFGHDIQALRLIEIQVFVMSKKISSVEKRSSICAGDKGIHF